MVPDPAPATPQTRHETTPQLLLTVEGAAERMNMSPRYVRRLVAERRIPFHRIGRAVRLAAADVDVHIAAGRVDAITASDAWRAIRSVAS
jgi:excisionase family DNA binding protein